MAHKTCTYLYSLTQFKTLWIHVIHQIQRRRRHPKRWWHGDNSTVEVLRDKVLEFLRKDWEWIPDFSKDEESTIQRFKSLGAAFKPAPKFSGLSFGPLGWDDDNMSLTVQLCARHNLLDCSKWQGACFEYPRWSTFLLLAVQLFPQMTNITKLELHHRQRLYESPFPTKLVRALLSLRLRPLHLRLRQFPLWIDDDCAILSRLKHLSVDMTNYKYPAPHEMLDVPDVKMTSGCFTSQDWWDTKYERMENKISNSIPLKSLTLISIQLCGFPLFFLHAAKLHSIAIDICHPDIMTVPLAEFSPHLKHLYCQRGDLDKFLFEYSRPLTHLRSLTIIPADINILRDLSATRPDGDLTTVYYDIFLSRCTTLGKAWPCLEELTLYYQAISYSLIASLVQAASPEFKLLKLVDCPGAEAIDEALGPDKGMINGVKIFVEFTGRLGLAGDSKEDMEYTPSSDEERLRGQMETSDDSEYSCVTTDEFSGEEGLEALSSAGTPSLGEAPSIHSS